jgi:predicted HTH transcriptional regulator
MRCERCGQEVDAAEIRNHGGQNLCEDCFLDTVSQVQTCDPWAVHLAKSVKGRGGLSLTPRQEKLYDLVKERKEISFSEAARLLGWSEEEVRRDFATLRHLEVLRACKRGDLVLMTLF